MLTTRRRRRRPRLRRRGRSSLVVCRCEDERRSGGEGRWPNEVKSTFSSDAAEERLAAAVAASSSLSCSWMRDGRFTKVVMSLYAV